MKHCKNVDSLFQKVKLDVEQRLRADHCEFLGSGSYGMVVRATNINFPLLKVPKEVALKVSIGKENEQYKIEKAHLNQIKERQADNYNRRFIVDYYDWCSLLDCKAECLVLGYASTSLDKVVQGRLKLSY
jgi:serine/threonine protein kinase